jgi:hypothetical protein
MKTKTQVILILLSSFLLAVVQAFGITSQQQETSVRNSVTGCPAFTITPPSVGAGVVVNAATFGVSTNNTGAQNYTDFVNAIAYCKSNSVYKLIVNPGTYDIGNYGSTYTADLYFNGLHDFIFDAQGSTFLFQAKNYFIEVNGCTRVVFQNLTINWDWSLEPIQSLTQIQDIDPNGNYVDMVYPYESNPSPTANIYEIDEVDGLNYDCAHSGMGVVGVWQMNTNETTKQSATVIRYFSNTNVVGKNWFNENGAYVGQYSVIRHYSYEHHGIYAYGNNNLTFTNMTTYSTLGIGYSLTDNQYYQIINSSIVRQPGSIYHFSSAADGIYVENSFGYFKIQNVEISHAGDDSINIHDTLSQGVSVTGANQLVAYNAISWQNPYNPGDLVELRKKDFSPLGWTSLVTASSYNGSQCSITFSNNLPANLDTNTVLFNHHYNSGNYFISGCYIHENKGRGSIVHVPNGTIENNEFMYNYNPGLFIACLATIYSEGFNPSNILVLNNLFEGNDIERDLYPATPNNVVITAQTDPVGIVSYPICQDILFEQNEIADCPYAALEITSATNVVAGEDTIESPNQFDNLSGVLGCVMIQNSGGVVFNNSDLILDAGVTSYETNIYVSSGTTANIFAAPFTPETLPADLGSWDVGNVGLGGSAAYSSGTYTVQGSGVDIWSTNDSFQFVWQPWNGDGQIVARVSAVGGTNPWAKAGIMYRETMDQDSRNTILLLTPSSGVSMQGRTNTDGPSVTVNTVTGLTAPRWIKLVRQGSLLTGSQSADGVTWGQVGVQTNFMTNSILVGLAVSSKSNSVLNTSTFDHVSAGGAWMNQDIGSVGLAGNSSIDYSNGVCTVAGSGSDIWGYGDEFQFLYQGASGDEAIVARVTNVQNTDPWAKAAVMIRETTATNSRNTTLFLSPGNGISLQGRTILNGLTGTQNTVAGLTAPQWIKLVRSSSMMNGYYSANGVNWTWIGSQTNTIATSYDIGLGVTSKTNGLLNTSTFDNISVSDAWTSEDIGSVGMAGGAVANNATGTFTVSGSGADIWGSDDAFQFYNQGFYGNGSISVRVDSTENINAWDKAGVMIRDTLLPGAINALLYVTPTNGLSFQGRTSTGGVTSPFDSVTGVTTPCWLKLARENNAVTAYWSSNGTNSWNLILSETVTISTNAWIGLAVGSKDNILLNTATFDNVTVTPTP